MIFGGIQLTTTLDYPGEIATILFTKGCNMHCGYCHNASIVNGEGSSFTDKEIFEKIIKRKHVIDHICISGGEPSIYGNELIQFLIRLKNHGFKVKLDTNGLNSEFLYQVIRLRLVDYIAMDVKTCLLRDEYSKVSGKRLTEMDMSAIRESIHYIMTSNIKFEFRTTVTKTYHLPDTLNKIAELRLPHHYLQKFINSDRIFDQRIEEYTDSEMMEILSMMQKINPKMELRGV